MKKFLSFLIIVSFFFQFNPNLASGEILDVNVDLYPICKSINDKTIDLGLFIFEIGDIGNNKISSIFLNIEETNEVSAFSTTFYNGSVFYRPIMNKRGDKYELSTTIFNMDIDSSLNEVGALGVKIKYNSLVNHILKYSVDVKIEGDNPDVLQFKGRELEIKLENFEQCSGDEYIPPVDAVAKVDYMRLYLGNRENYSSYRSSDDEKCYIKKPNDYLLSSSRFLDIPSETEMWVKESVGRLKKCDVVIGYEDGTFKPWDNVSRAELTKMVINMANARERLFPVGQITTMPFSDVDDKSWWYVYIATAFQYNVINGYNDHTFKPFNNITREEALKIILGTFKFDVDNYQSSQINEFTDINTNNWSYKYVVFAKDKNIISMSADKRFRPYEFITRAEISKILINAVDIKDNLN